MPLAINILFHTGSGMGPITLTVASHLNYIQAAAFAQFLRDTPRAVWSKSVNLPVFPLLAVDNQCINISGIFESLYCGPDITDPAHSRDGDGKTAIAERCKCQLVSDDSQRAIMPSCIPVCPAGFGPVATDANRPVFHVEPPPFPHPHRPPNNHCPIGPGTDGQTCCKRQYKSESWIHNNLPFPGCRHDSL